MDKLMMFNRSRLILGTDVMKRLEDAKVILLGVGGVGSWCAECLVRTGVKHLTIVDSDRVAESNINRQLMATSENVGSIKVEALKKRLLAINPDARITAICQVFTETNANEFHLESYDFIIDAIDSLADKMALINLATRTPAYFYSSMGAALKIDPTRIQIAEFWKVKGCPLARALRTRMKRTHQFPAKKFKCVFSDELVTNHPFNVPSKAFGDSIQDPSFPGILPENPGHNKAVVNGSLMHITAIFGMMLASLVIQECCKE